MRLADKLSIFRILLVPFFVASVVYYDTGREYLRWMALAIFFLAAITDVFDGKIARQSGGETTLGKIFDPLADKLLTLSAFILLSVGNNFTHHYGQLPAYLLITVVSRDVIIVLGTILIYLHTNQIKIAPSILGKICTFFQMAVIISVFLVLPKVFSKGLVWAVVLFTILSGLDYIRRGMRFFST